MKKKVILIVVLVLLAIVALNSFFTVKENQYACTVRFSQIIDTPTRRACTSRSPSWIPSGILPRQPSCMTSPLPRC